MGLLGLNHPGPKSRLQRLGGGGGGVGGQGKTTDRDSLSGRTETGSWFRTRANEPPDSVRKNGDCEQSGVSRRAELLGMSVKVEKS